MSSLAVFLLRPQAEAQIGALLVNSLAMRLKSHFFKILRASFTFFARIALYSESIAKSTAGILSSKIVLFYSSYLHHP